MICLMYHFRFSVFVPETLKLEWQCSQYLELNPTCGTGNPSNSHANSRAWMLPIQLLDRQGMDISTLHGNRAVDWLVYWFRNFIGTRCRDHVLILFLKRRGPTEKLPSEIGKFWRLWLCKWKQIREIIPRGDSWLICTMCTNIARRL